MNWSWLPSDKIHVVIDVMKTDTTSDQLLKSFDHGPLTLSNFKEAMKNKIETSNYVYYLKFIDSNGKVYRMELADENDVILTQDLSIEKNSKISYLVLEPIAPAVAIQNTNRLQINVANPQDITRQLCINIQNYVLEKFTSCSEDFFDLIQDEVRIMEVFNKNSDIAYQSIKNIGKIRLGSAFNYVQTGIQTDPYVKKIFEFGSNEATESDFHKLFHVIFETPPAKYDSELNCTKINYLLYEKPMQQYLKSSGYTLLQVLSDKAQNDAVSTTQTKKTNNALQTFKDPLIELTKYKSFGTLRPDSRLQDGQGRIFERVEVKATSGDIVLAECELVDKCFRLNQYQYGDIKIQFGLALGGNKLNLHLINFKKPKCELNCKESHCPHQTYLKTNKQNLILLREFNLTTFDDRIALFFNVLVIAEMCEKLRYKYQCRDQFHKFKHPDTLPRERNGVVYATISFSYLLNMVEKEVTDLNQISSTKLLEQFYQLIFIEDKSTKVKRPVTDTVKATYLKVSDQKFKVRITPIGYNSAFLFEKVNESANEFKKAIICVMEAALSMHANGYVHQDIRWDNITYDFEQQTYLLFDFEQIGLLCDWNCQDEDHEEFDCTPAILDAAYIIKLFGHPALKNIDKWHDYVEFAKGLDSNSINEIAKNYSQAKKDATLTHPKRAKGRKSNQTNEKIKTDDKRITKIVQLFWKFYYENITDVKKGLKDFEKRRDNAEF